MKRLAAQRETMTSQYLLPDIRRDEGLRLHAYPDPLSHGEPYTIGYGHTGGIEPGTIWTLAQAEGALQQDVAKAEAGLDAYLPWWRTQLTDERQDVLVNMAFNLGVEGLLKFRNTLALIQAGNYKAAADNMLVSLWARQVGSRAHRLAEQMRTSVHALPPGTYPLPLPAPIPAPVAAPEPDPVPVAPEQPAPVLSDPGGSDDVPNFTPLWRDLLTMARDRIASFGGGGAAIGAAALAWLHKLSAADAILLVGAGLFVLVLVLWLGSRKEHRQQAEKVAALNAQPPGPKPDLTDAQVAAFKAFLSVLESRGQAA